MRKHRGEPRAERALRAGGCRWRKALAPLAARVALLTAVALPGCGSSQRVGGYTWGSLYREDVSTVAVPAFESDSFRQGDEFRLTQAVARQIESRTPYKVVDRRRADTVLEGRITDVGVGTLSRDRNTNLPQEQLYTVRVDFTWKDLRTGQVLVDRRGFEQSVTFYPTLGEGAPVGGQQAAEELAAAIVDELQADW